MNRSIYVQTDCGCSMPGITKALDRERFEKSASLRQRNKPTHTRVAKFVDKTAVRVARMLAPILAQAGSDAAAKVSARYASVQKADKDLIEQLLELAGAASMSAAAARLLKSQIEQAFRTGATEGLSQIADLKNVDIGDVLTPAITDQVDPEAVFYAANRGGELIKDLAGTTDDDMRELLSSSIEDGVTPDELADRIQDLGAFSDARAMTIARTELAFAYVQGNVEGWKASGEVEKKRWILGDLHDIEDVCDDCVDAGTVDIDDDFAEGIDYPPAHPNCICDVLPVLVDRSGDDDDNSDD